MTGAHPNDTKPLTKKQLDFEDEYRELQMKALRIANNQAIADIKINRQNLTYRILGRTKYKTGEFDEYKKIYIKIYKMLENL